MAVSKCVSLPSEQDPFLEAMADAAKAVDTYMGGIGNLFRQMVTYYF